MSVCGEHQILIEYDRLTFVQSFWLKRKQLSFLGERLCHIKIRYFRFVFILEVRFDF